MRFIHKPTVTFLLVNFFFIHISVIIVSNLKILNNSVMFIHQPTMTFLLAIFFFIHISVIIVTNLKNLEFLTILPHFH